MKRMAGLAAAAVLIGGAGLWWYSSQVSAAGLFPYTDKTVTRAGQALYAENCASCHGAQLEGEPDWRTRDADGYLPAPPHDETGHTWHHPDEQLLAITMLGTEKLVGNGYKSRMAGYEGQLSEDEAISILAYIKSTWPARVIEQHNQINASN